MKKAVFKNFAIFTAEFIQSGKIRGKKENLRKVGENQVKLGNFFHGLEKLCFSD